MVIGGYHDQTKYVVERLCFNSTVAYHIVIPFREASVAQWLCHSPACKQGVACSVPVFACLSTVLEYKPRSRLHMTLAAGGTKNPKLTKCPVEISEDNMLFQNDNDIRNGLIFDDFENAPRNWLIPAICSAVFFFPTGIFAVRNAIKVTFMDTIMDLYFILNAIFYL